MSQTALQLTPEELRSFRPARRLEESQRSKAPEVEARLLRAWEAAREAARLLKEQFDAQRVLVFGSLVHPERFSRWSDIDMAVQGLPARKFYRAVAEATGLSGEFQIDIVDLESCRPAMRERIELEGKELAVTDEDLAPE